MNKIMIVGTFHFTSQKNISNFHQQDLLKQCENELTELAIHLADFKPTRVSVEIDRDLAARIDTEYADHLAGRCTEESEVGRLAFPVAKAAGLDRIDCVDWMKNGSAEHGCGDVFEYMLKNQPALAEELSAYQMRAQQPDLTKESVRDAYRRFNAPEFADDTLSLYINLARIGAEDYYGCGWLQWWYQRNLRIFANLCALAEGKDNERILLLIGAAHKGILEQFIRNSHAFEIVDSLEYI